MPALKNVGGEWRLFWVLETMGLSLGLALLIIKQTGNDDAVSKGAPCESVWETEGCLIYDWWFIMFIHPSVVTTLALVVVRAVSRRDISVVVRVLCPPSLDWCWFSFVVIMWAIYQAWYRWETSQIPFFMSASLGAIMLLVGGIACWVGCDYCRQLKLACARGSPGLCPVHRQYRRWLFWSRVGLILIELLLNLTLVTIRVQKDISGEFENRYIDKVYEPLHNCLRFAQAVHFLATYIWLIFGMEMTNIRSPSFLTVDPARALPPAVISLLIGWCSCEGLSALQFFAAENWLNSANAYTYGFAVSSFVYGVTDIMWNIMLGTLLWGWTAEVWDIAYWHTATILVYLLMSCVGTWLHAANDGIMG